MKSNTAARSAYFDTIKWIITSVLLILVIVGNYFYHNFSTSLRVAVIVCVVGLAFFIVSTTLKGKQLFTFIYKAYMGTKEVNWPKRQDVLIEAIFVVIITAILSLVLWGIDSILVRLITLITGLRF